MRGRSKQNHNIVAPFSRLERVPVHQFGSWKHQKSSLQRPILLFYDLFLSIRSHKPKRRKEISKISLSAFLSTAYEFLRSVRNARSINLPLCPDVSWFHISWLYDCLFLSSLCSDIFWYRVILNYPLQGLVGLWSLCVLCGLKAAFVKHSALIGWNPIFMINSWPSNVFAGL